MIQNHIVCPRLLLSFRSPQLPKHYTVSDGELELFLWPAEEGGYNVTSPLDPALMTQAETVEEAFVMGHDVIRLLCLKHPEKHECPPR